MKNIKQTFYDKLEEYSKLENDWIPNGKPIDKDIIETSKLIIDKMNNFDHWTIAPFANGSILLYYHFGSNKGCVNIAIKGISCFMDINSNFKKMVWHFNDDKENVINELVEFIKID
jgi:hypothetical protein